MYIVIMGGGRVGLSLADRLIIHGYDVTISFRGIGCNGHLW